MSVKPSQTSQGTPVSGVWPTLHDQLTALYDVVVELLPHAASLLWSHRRRPNRSRVSRDPLYIAKLPDDPVWQI